jgi:hypothetical protein
MDDSGRLTGWTAFLILTGIGLLFAGAALAPDGSLYTWLLVAAYGVTLTALNNIHRKVRGKVREREIRDDERKRLAGREDGS